MPKIYLKRKGKMEAEQVKQQTQTLSKLLEAVKSQTDTSAESTRKSMRLAVIRVVIGVLSITYSVIKDYFF